MNKIKTVFIASIFVSSSLLSMPGQFKLDTCRKVIDDIISTSSAANSFKKYAKIADIAFKVADSIRVAFLDSKEFDGNLGQKCEFIAKVLDFYKKAHEVFISNKCKYSLGCIPPEDCIPPAIPEWRLCDRSVQKAFQERVEKEFCVKAGETFAEHKSTVFQCFAEMRKLEYEALRHVNGSFWGLS